MLSLPSLLSTAIDLVDLYPTKIASFMRTNYGSRFEEFLGDGGKLETPEELEDKMSFGEGKLEIWIYPETLKMEVHKLDEMYYATSILWIVCNQRVSPWEIRSSDELLHLYYAAIIWALLETR
jgi:hypothetical protein